MLFVSRVTWWLVPQSKIYSLNCRYRMGKCAEVSEVEVLQIILCSVFAWGKKADSILPVSFVQSLPWLCSPRDQIVTCKLGVLPTQSIKVGNPIYQSAPTQMSLGHFVFIHALLTTMGSRFVSPKSTSTFGEMQNTQTPFTSSPVSIERLLHLGWSPKAV